MTAIACPCGSQIFGAITNPLTHTINTNNMQQIHFNQVLEIAESLSDSEQNFLIEILQKRLQEKRRKQIAANIAEAHAEYKMGKTQKVTIDDLMADLD